MLTIEQVLSCDLCGREIRRLKRDVAFGRVNEIINGPEMHISPGNKDVCADCYGPLMETFHSFRSRGRTGLPE